MKLHQYLSMKNERASAFAARIGAPASTVSRWLSGDRSPSLDSVAKVEVATGGLVTAADFMPPTLPLAASPENANHPEVLG